MLKCKLYTIYCLINVVLTLAWLVPPSHLILAVGKGQHILSSWLDYKIHLKCQLKVFFMILKARENMLFLPTHPTVTSINCIMTTGMSTVTDSHALYRALGEGANDGSDHSFAEVAR